MIATELHSFVDVLSARISFRKDEEGFVDHRQENAIDDESRCAFDGDGRLTKLPGQRRSCVVGSITGLQPTHYLDQWHDGDRIEEMQADESLGMRDRGRKLGNGYRGGVGGDN